MSHRRALDHLLHRLHLLFLRLLGDANDLERGVKLSPRGHRPPPPSNRRHSQITEFGRPAEAPPWASSSS
eukprot:536727-Prymnesium_polylepis.1